MFVNLVISNLQPQPSALLLMECCSGILSEIYSWLIAHPVFLSDYQRSPPPFKDFPQLTSITYVSMNLNYFNTIYKLFSPLYSIFRRITVPSLSKSYLFASILDLISISTSTSSLLYWLFSLFSTLLTRFSSPPSLSSELPWGSNAQN